MITPFSFKGFIYIFMTTIKIVEVFETFGELAGYLNTAEKTYNATNTDYEVDYGLADVQGRILFRTEVIVYGKKRSKKDG